MLHFLVLFLFPLFAQEIDHSKLKSGDVILLPLNCQLCRAIMLETSSVYAHSGIILKKNEEWYVAEALGSVRLVSLKSFVKRAWNQYPLKIVRLKELQQRFLTSKESHQDFSDKALELFSTQFEHLSFDHEFLWDNRDIEGKESYYCSEFVAKFLNHFIKNKITPLPMSFDRSPSFWWDFFEGLVPQGKEGLSPGDLERQEIFQIVD